jgi:hypothetical protein
LLALDGEPTPSVDALLRLLTAERIGKPIEVSLLRGRERLAVTVVPEATAPRNDLPRMAFTRLRRATVPSRWISWGS